MDSLRNTKCAFFYQSFFVVLRGFWECGFNFNQILYLSAQMVDHVYLLVHHCIDINTKEVQHILCLIWFKSSYEPMRKPALIHVRTRKAQISPFFKLLSTEKLLTNLIWGGGRGVGRWQNYFWNVFSHTIRFLLKYVVSGLFSPLNLYFRESKIPSYIMQL